MLTEAVYAEGNMRSIIVICSASLPVVACRSLLVCVVEVFCVVLFFATMLTLIVRLACPLGDFVEHCYANAVYVCSAPRISAMLVLDGIISV